MLITITEVKDLTTIQKNVDDYLVTNAILYAEEKHIASCIGQDLYDDAVANPGTAENTALIAEIKPALALWVQYEVIPDLHIKETNKGIVMNFSDNSNNFSTRDVEYKRRIVKDRANFKTAKIIDFLEYNSDDYPLYKSTSNCCDSGKSCGTSAVYFPKDDDCKKPIWLP